MDVDGGYASRADAATGLQGGKVAVEGSHAYLQLMVLRNLCLFPIDRYKESFFPMRFNWSIAFARDGWCHGILSHEHVTTQWRRT